MLKGFAEEFKVCLENQELPDASTIFELAVQDSQSLCGGVSLSKKVALLKSIVAVGSIDKDVLALQASRERLGEVRSSLQTLRSSSELFPGSIKLQFGQHADSDACYFWIYSFGEATSEVKWTLFRREFIQHYQDKIDPGNFSKLLTRLRVSLFKGDESGNEVVHVESVCKLASRAANQTMPRANGKAGNRPGGGAASWYDVAAVAMRRSLTKSRGSMNRAGHFSLLSPPLLVAAPVAVAAVKGADCYQGSGGHDQRIV
eukprot:COSAG06_NODE_2213_length_7329_cov_10.371784_1_plen_259_part_00